MTRYNNCVLHKSSYQLFWKFYSFLFLGLMLSNLWQLFNSNSLLMTYYSLTIVFSKWFIVPYVLNVFEIFVGCVVCVLLFAYAFKAQRLTMVSPALLYVRLFSDCTGHDYEFKMVQAGFSAGNIWGFIALASLAVPLLPSYLALWRMAFSKK